MSMCRNKSESKSLALPQKHSLLRTTSAVPISFSQTLEMYSMQKVSWLASWGHHKCFDFPEARPFSMASVFVMLSSTRAVCQKGDQKVRPMHLNQSRISKTVNVQTSKTVPCRYVHALICSIYPEDIGSNYDFPILWKE